jgi:CDP-paratose synthetase
VMSVTPQTVLLTGATGFLGSHLACAWVRDGHRVAILKRRNSRLERLASVLDQLKSFDIEDGIEAPFKAIGHIDAVIHCATCYGRSGESAVEMFEANTAFPLRLLEVATIFKTDTFFNADTILDKYLNAYALSKNNFAEWGRSYSSDGRIRFINIRLEHMYGPGDDARKFTTHVIKSCLSNTSELNLTAGEQRRDFIYISDVVSAYTTLLEKNSILERAFLQFGLGSGRAVTIRDFVEQVHRLSQSLAQLNFGAIPYRAGEMMESVADLSSLKDLGWEPRFTLARALQETITQEKATA